MQTPEFSAFSKPRTNSVAESPGAMIVGTTGADAVKTGLATMAKGGSAADAALATALSQVALTAGSWVSYAGILSLVYYEAATNHVHYLNGGYNTMQNEVDPLSIPKMGTPSGPNRSGAGLHGSCPGCS